MRITERILRWTCIIGVFLLPFVPLIVSTFFFFPFITGKNFAFRIVVELIGFSWLGLCLLNPAYRPKRSWVLGAFALFVFVMAVADLQGVHPFKSFWSNFERMDGWITIAHLLIYAVVASSVLNAERLWRWLLELNVGVSLFLSIFGFLQVAGVTALGEVEGGAGLSARIDATFGNPIYLAVYMLFSAFFALLLIAQGRNERWSLAEKISYGVFLLGGLGLVLSNIQSSAAYFWTILIYVAFFAAAIGLMFARKVYLLSLTIVFDVAALCLTGTRGTILGIIGGVIVTAFLIALFGEVTQRVRTSMISVLAAIVIVAFGFWAVRDAAWVKQVGFLERLSTISLQDATTKSRLLNIETAWHGVQEKPLLGWGQENYAIVFDKYYDPRMYAQEPWFDRVHDILFDWLIAGGIIGLASYLSIFAGLVWAIWRRRAKDGATAFTYSEKSILTGLLAGYFFHNLFVFDNVTSYILFGTVAAYVVFREGSAFNLATIPRRYLVGASYAPYVALASLFLAVGTAYAVNVPSIEQNVTLLKALMQQQSGAAQNLALFDDAISYGTLGTQEAREQLAQAAASLASDSSLDANTRQEFFQDAVRQMTLQEQASPLDARFPLFVGTVQDAFGDHQDAAASLALAHKLSPDKQSILFSLGQNAISRNDLSGAQDIFKQAYQLDTEDTQAALYYAASAIRNGDEAAADDVLAPLVKSGQAADQQVALAYASRNEYAKIIPIWSAHVAADPTDPQPYLTLALAYYELGNHAQAISTLQALEKVAPADATQVDSIIAQMQSGTLQLQ